MTTLHSNSGSASERALVLHGGGSAGNAWEIGVVAGFLDAGMDVTAADLIVGTSAGATAAAQITHARPADLLRDILDAAPPAHPPTGRSTVDHLDRTNRIIAASKDAADMRHRIGAAAVDLESADPGWSGRWRAIVAGRLPGVDWPDQRILITAVDARSGEMVAFDPSSGVDLVDAVAASTSSGAAYRIGDDLYIDGGYRRNENADLAAGCRRVLILSPFGGRTRHPLEWGMQLDKQVAELRDAGSTVEIVVPDETARDAFGSNMMDPRTRPPAARAGYHQGRGADPKVQEFWR
ncbi:patatin-like phospholipase family protein [Nakamurella sp. YIM 132087]|uniref:Patatin-like phospholipase family protein n=1 Tax=Nakamurella alba TaxID=2665158 RepID=A0A7K1FRV3_9ACTN|nr:patatin-like phospholipase family protein [Nakamurella alba]MTD16875.1 patatin-like phospholipase family protein [Nakamurella alba]